MATAHDANARDGDSESKPRVCDDMLVRRLAGNIPAQFKKMNVDSHKKFITPTGNPMQYVQNHKKSQVFNEHEEEKLAEDRERDDRNTRYEEMETLKDMLKEEEAQWTSKLDNWKQRRRSATLDVRQRSEERHNIMMKQTEAAAATPRRRAKTYREIVEDKKRRDSGVDQYNDAYLSSSTSFDISTDEDRLFERLGNKKQYRGAVSVPTIILRKSDIADAITQPLATKKLSENDENSNASPENSFQETTLPAKASSSLAHVAPEIEKQTVPSVSASGAKFSTRNANQSNNNNSHLTHNSTATQNHIDKKPFESTHNAHAQPSPVRCSTSTSDLSDNEISPSNQVGFANKRNMWENIGAIRNTNMHARPVPIDLSTLLKQDDEKLQVNGTSSPSSTQSNSSQASGDGLELQSSPANNNDAAHVVHKPKIMGLGCNRADSNLANKDLAHSQHAFEPIHKYGNTPVIIGSFPSTLPSKPRITTSLEEKATQKEENSLRLNLSGLKGPAFSPRRSPRQGTSSVGSMFEDLNISINQRPKCEKGFGFTVRGGEDGKPVVVNTVSPGGAADHCQLRVGDEILAINDVRLSEAQSQDDIVQLIVQSVITGNLSLVVRRYGKSKKSTPRPFPGGFKTSGGLLPIRSSKDIFNTSKHLSNKVKEESRDLAASLINQQVRRPTQSEAENLPNTQRKPKQASPLFRNQSMTSSSRNSELFSGKENKREAFSSGVGNYKREPYSVNASKSATLPLNVVVKEWSAWPTETHDTEGKYKPPEKHVSSKEELKREEEKKKRIEEALAEERRITAQLKAMPLASVDNYFLQNPQLWKKLEIHVEESTMQQSNEKIEASKLKQQRRREEEKRKMLISESPDFFGPFFDSLSKLSDETEQSRGSRSVTNKSLSNHGNRTPQERYQP